MMSVCDCIPLFGAAGVLLYACLPSWAWDASLCIVLTSAAGAPVWLRILFAALTAFAAAAWEAGRRKKRKTRKAY